RVLLEHGADLNARSHVWNQLMAQSPHAHPEHQAWVLHGGNTALLFAARAGDLESVRLLVHAGADVNVESAWGFTPLAIAAYADIGEWFVIQEETNDRFVYFETDDILPGDYGEIVTLLLEEGADPNGGAHRFTPLIAAVMRENEDGVRQLLAHGADPNLALGDFTPHQRGSSTDLSFHKSRVGASPLCLAARLSTPEAVRVLLSIGDDHRRVLPAVLL